MGEDDQFLTDGHHILGARLDGNRRAARLAGFLILATTLLPLRAMKSLLIALQFHHKAAPGRLVDRAK